MVPLGSTQADRMVMGSKETDGSSVKNFPTLGAALVGGELPVPGSMQVEAEESLGQDAERESCSHQQGEGTGLDKGSLLASPAHFQPKQDPTHRPWLMAFHQSESG